MTVKQCNDCGDCRHICDGNMRGDSYDITSIASKIDSNGYLKIKGTFTRAGIFKYENPDGTLRRELRHPDDVMRADSINTLKLIPVAPLLDHAMTMLNLQSPTATDQFKSIGTTGENINITKDAALDGSLAIYDKKTIVRLLKADKNKKLPEISAAYLLPNGIDKTPGYFDGSKWGIESGNYDVRQLAPFNYGHVTLVDKGRAGSRCQIRADSAENEDSKEEKNMGKRTIPELVIGTFRADALEIEETPDMLNLLAQRVRLGVELAKTQQRADTVEGEKAALTQLNKDMQTKLDDAIPQTQYRADLQESLELLKMAEELGLKIKDDFTPKALKLTICSKIDPEMKTRADMSDGFLNGVFSQIKGTWAQRLKERKTIKNLNNHLNDDAKVSDTEYEDHGNIE